MASSIYLAASFAMIGTVSIVVACTSSAAGVDACRSIEEARCERAAGDCNLLLATPLSRDGRDVSSCITYYDEECKHGLASNADPSSAQVNACVAAIKTGPCTVVEAPETALECSFLIVPIASTDGGQEGEASSEASTEASSESGADAATE